VSRREALPVALRWKLSWLSNSLVAIAILLNNIASKKTN